MKTVSQISEARIRNSMRARFNPIKSLTPDSLSRMLDEFSRGYLSSAAFAWDSIEHRDDMVQSVASKRKRSVARLNWEILTMDQSADAIFQKQALEYFYDNLQTTNAFDCNEQGSFGLLVKQMMDAIGKKYAVHVIIFKTNEHFNDTALPYQKLTASFRFVPLWFFENTTGNLRFLKDDYATTGIPLDHDSWLITVGDGLMESTSIAYIFKHLPLRDWLVYCERNGMPGVKGITDAIPGSDQWEAARDAVEDFGAEFSALMSQGTTIEAIDLSTKGDLPYPGLIDRMDRAIAALWRGSDLATLSRSSGVGASLQADETTILLEDDANMISETLNEQVDRRVLRYLFGDVQQKAYIRLITPTSSNGKDEVAIYRTLHEMGVPLAIEDIREKFGLPTPGPDEAILGGGRSSEVPSQIPQGAPCPLTDYGTLSPNR
jgi:phage gp29-like protein